MGFSALGFLCPTVLIYVRKERLRLYSPLNSITNLYRNIWIYSCHYSLYVGNANSTAHFNSHANCKARAELSHFCSEALNLSIRKLSSKNLGYTD